MTSNTLGVQVHGHTPSELLLGYNPQAGRLPGIFAHIILERLSSTAHGLRLSQINKQRDQARETIVACTEAREIKERDKEMIGVELREVIWSCYGDSRWQIASG
jgi:hypothetical protein